ncbi:agglutination protein [Rhodobacteraceae bacterium RKSG542]|nr:agglutination protein [Pseudovibrio flavus]
MPTTAMSLREALNLTVYSNPQVGEAIFDRNAIGYELKQAKGQWLPRLDLEARGGAEWSDKPTNRNSGDYAFGPYEVSAIATQKIFDGFATTYEIERQRARLDSTSFRVWERSEFIGLAAVRSYLEITRLSLVQGAARRNIAYHERVASDMREGLSRGVVSVADVQQANERLIAAKVFLTEADEERELAEAEFIDVVGRPIGHLGKIDDFRNRIPGSLNAVLASARNNNPLISLTNADVDVANAQVKIAEADYYPRFDLELSSRFGENLDGVNGRDANARAQVVMRWNLFNGNITTNRRAEEIERASEARMRSQQAYREVERETRLSWIRRVELDRQLKLLTQQLAAARQVLSSYEEQFTVGQRSLLDVLDTQNSVFQSEVAEISARYALRFSDFRMLAAMGQLLSSFSIQPPAQSEAGYRTVEDFRDTGKSLVGAPLPGVAASWRRGVPVPPTKEQGSVRY